MPAGLPTLWLTQKHTPNDYTEAGCPELAFQKLPGGTEEPRFMAMQ